MCFVVSSYIFVFQTKIPRCHGMMQIPQGEIEPFLHWTNATTGKTLTVEANFQMSAKVYASFDGPERGMLASFTTIVPGAGKGKDPYWTIENAWQHLVEVAQIFKWVHRRLSTNLVAPIEYCVQPVMHAIFDGSSNHTARALDGLNVGSGINKGPGGANAPGAPLKNMLSTEKKYRMKMKNGWFIDKFGKRVEQQMHREKWESDDKNSHTKAIHNDLDGTICKGVEEILREMEDDLVAVDKVQMPFRCNKARRRKLQLASEKLCTAGVRCCMHNTLRCRQDFCEQKCKLEEVCEAVGVVFHLLLICHPELNPIEGHNIHRRFACVRQLPS